ncbi:MAG: sigma-70 family RNA polymerase sigma factor [Actinobacteria bacterium]|nr:sigma-70 family RNA polymerase sigma factor [Actinomycetota bacterium]
MAVAYSDVEQVFAAGQPEGLAAAYSMWGALIYTVARRGSGSAEAAADITQRTFLSAWHGPRDVSLDLKARLVLTARTLVRRHLEEQGADRAAQAAADAVIDRVVVRDELTALAEPARSVLLRALAPPGTRPVSVDANGSESQFAADALLEGLQQLEHGLAGSRSV